MGDKIQYSILGLVIAIFIMQLGFNFLSLYRTYVYTGNDWKRVFMPSIPTAANNDNNAQVPQAPEVAFENVDLISESDYVRGNRNASIVLIEYADLDCPFCAQFHKTAQQLVDEMGDEIAWVSRHFPLAQLHPNARLKAIATECAGVQGGNDAFWEMTDALYEDQSIQGTEDSLVSLASTLGFDGEILRTCLSNESIAAKVDAQYQSGLSAGITGTPGNIIVNVENQKVRLIPGALPIDFLKAEIEKVR